ncbi:MAG: HAD family hydrolase [Acidimicrobiales bacterium]
MTLFADQLGIAEPDPRIYDHLLQLIGRSANEVVHVGDSLVNEVDAAGRVGIGTVWLNRFDEQPSQSLLQPRATIRTLAELPAVMHNWPEAG